MNNQSEQPADGIVVVRQGALSDNTAQTSGMPRRAAISPGNGARQLWMGRVTGQPGMNSGPHHHGEAETCGYVLSGRCRVYYGEGFAQHVDLEAGDFIYVAPFVPHIEANPHDEACEFVTVRTPDNIVVNLPAASSPHQQPAEGSRTG
jgi:uncharacterized RmlC-like cupin family protein